MNKLFISFSLIFFLALSLPREVLAQKTLDPQILFDKANAHRISLQKAAFLKEDSLCQLAQSRAPQLAGEFNRGALHQGFFARKLPFWASENVILMSTEEKAFAWWMNSRVHRSAIEGDYKYACVGCLNNTCAMIFTNFTPKY